MITKRPAEHAATRRILELVQWNLKLFTASVGYGAGDILCLDAIISVVCEKFTRGRRGTNSSGQKYARVPVSKTLGLLRRWSGHRMGVTYGHFRPLEMKSRTTKLRGPKSNNLLFGVSKELFESSDIGGMFEAWSKEYGVAYEIPMICGEKRIALCDPRAVAHLFSKDTWTYFGMKSLKRVRCTEGSEEPWDLRSVLPAIRKLTPAVHKVIDKLKAAWEASIEASGGDSVVLDVQKWTNYVSLDSFGIAGLSYDFNSLNGKPNPMISVLDSFSEGVPQSAFSIAVTVFILFFPIAMHIPTHRNQMFGRLHKRMTELCDALIDNANANRDAGEHGSTIDLLLRAEDEDSGQRISREEVLSQSLKLLLNSCARCLSRPMKPHQVRIATVVLNFLRYNEMIAFSDHDMGITRTCTAPEHSRLSFVKSFCLSGENPPTINSPTDLPYLDAIVQEVLRLHPSVPEMLREAAEDDVIPLSEPVQTKSGEFVDSIVVERGTIFTRFGVQDAKVFRPERWLEPDGITKKAQEVKGHRHLLSFGDGPRTCIGKTFALAVIKTGTFDGNQELCSRDEGRTGHESRVEQGAYIEAQDRREKRASGYR
ncbi:cytochrome P450 [Pisolithus croceorrhizus]|nr:cytochrome P450 [Pisolithus croceorrhizus]